MMNIQSLDKFHKTRPGYAIFGLVELGIAYGFASWAIDTGILLWWVITIILFVGFLQNMVRMVLHKKAPNKLREDTNRKVRKGMLSGLVDILPWMWW